MKRLRNGYCDDLDLELLTRASQFFSLAILLLFLAASTVPYWLKGEALPPRKDLVVAAGLAYFASSWCVALFYSDMREKATQFGGPIFYFADIPWRAPKAIWLATWIPGVLPFFLVSYIAMRRRKRDLSLENQEQHDKLALAIAKAKQLTIEERIPENLQPGLSELFWKRWQSAQEIRRYELKKRKEQTLDEIKKAESTLHKAEEELQKIDNLLTDKHGQKMLAERMANYLTRLRAIPEVVKVELSDEEALRKVEVLLRISLEDEGKRYDLGDFLLHLHAKAVKPWLLYERSGMTSEGRLRYHDKLLDGWIKAASATCSYANEGFLDLAVKNFVEEVRRHAAASVAQKEWPKVFLSYDKTKS